MSDNVIFRQLACFHQRDVFHKLVDTVDLMNSTERSWLIIKDLNKQRNLFFLSAEEKFVLNSPLIIKGVKKSIIM